VIAWSYVFLAFERMEEYLMCGDGKEAYRISAVLYSEELLNSVASVCNACSSYCTCTIAKSVSAPDLCEVFRTKGLPS